MITEPIKVSMKDAKSALHTLDFLNIRFTQSEPNAFLIPDEDEWNEAMEAFESQNIELCVE